MKGKYFTTPENNEFGENFNINIKKKTTGAEINKNRKLIRILIILQKYTRRGKKHTKKRTLFLDAESKMKMQLFSRFATFLRCRDN